MTTGINSNRVSIMPLIITSRFQSIRKTKTRVDILCPERKQSKKKEGGDKRFHNGPRYQWRNSVPDISE